MLRTWVTYALLSGVFLVEPGTTGRLSPLTVQPSGAEPPIHAGAPALPMLSAFSRALTVNGTTVQPAVWCQGSAASSTGLECDGETLTAGGTDGAFGVGSPLGAGTAVDPEGTRFYTAIDTSYGDISTAGMVIEWVAEHTDTTGVLASKLDDSGWELTKSSGAYTLTLHDGGTPVTVSTAALPDAYHHGLIVVDPDGMAQPYANGIATGTAVDVSGVGSTTSTVALRLFADQSAANGYDAGVVHFAVWAVDPGTHLQPQLARDRAAAAFGVPPGFAASTARASVATVERDGHLYAVGAGWMRVESSGYLSEIATTNLVLHSEDLGASWTATRINVIGTIDLSGVTLHGLAPTADEGTHCVSQVVGTLTADSYTLSAFGTPGEQGGFSLAASSSSIAAEAFVETHTCHVLSASGTTRTAARQVGDVCRGEFTFTAAAEETTVSVCQFLEGDGSTVHHYVGGVQFEAQPVATSYVATVDSTAARSADVLIYTIPEFDIDDSGITLVATGTLPAYTASTFPALLGISDGGATSNRITIYESCAGLPSCVVTASNAATAVVSGTTRLRDGTQHTLACYVAEDDVRLFVDGAPQGTPDTNAAVPDDLDTVSVGVSQGPVNQAQGHISSWAVYRGEVVQ